ncbi:MAG: glycerophosphodiester phosphodiesterase family protein [Christensenellales bacterium]|jgi:glycerophosphoryl diester phosphodiesterase
MNTIRINAKAAKMVAHRGLSGIEQENTCAAFVAAGNRSYYGIETDIRVTADGEYVAFHDDDTRRVGLDRLVVEETTFLTLRGLLLAERETSRRGRSDLRIPTLKEYVGICKTYEKECVLELKNRISPDHISRIVEIIREAGWLERVTFISFDLQNLVNLRQLLPDQKLQYLTADVSGETIAALNTYGMDLDVLYTCLNPENIKTIHAAGHKVNCWTVDDPAIAEQLADWGVDFITTNILEAK